MDTLEMEASQWLTDYLGQLAGAELSEAERHAAFMLICTLPNDTTLKGFVEAADVTRVKQAGLPESVAQNLAPLVDRLKKRVADEGWFGKFFESTEG